MVRFNVALKWCVRMYLPTYVYTDADKTSAVEMKILHNTDIQDTEM
jgi:hypothetical protein